VAIVSPKPQTTRGRILGVVTRPEAQVAFVDTPGIHQAKGPLNRHMVDVALAAIAEADLVLFMIEPKGGKVDPGNRFILDRLKGKPVLLAINKVDAIPKPVLLPIIDLYRTELPFLEIIPISALDGDGIEQLLRAVFAHLPEGPRLFDPETFTDQQERDLVAELVREQVIRKMEQELPYSTAVAIDVFDESDRATRRLVRIAATVYVERESQKGIVIGKRGQMLKEIGTAARKQVERLLGARTFLSLRVKVEPDWSERPDALKKLGYA
jgi:GTP-binding protein Era